MKLIKDLTVQVTYTVGLGDVEMPEDVYNEIIEADKKGVHFDMTFDKNVIASSWLVDNINEADCMEWKAEILEITESEEEVKPKALEDIQATWEELGRDKNN